MDSAAAARNPAVCTTCHSHHIGKRQEARGKRQEAIGNIGIMGNIRTIGNVQYAIDDRQRNIINN